MSASRLVPCLGFALALVLLGTGCFDFDKDFKDCVADGGNCATDDGVPDSGTPDGGPCLNRLCLMGTYKTPGSTALFSVWGAEPDKVWFVGQFMHSAYWNGSQFTHGKIGPADYDYYLYKLWGTSSSDVWAVGNAGTILRFNGSQWEDQNAGPDLGQLRGAWSPAPNQILIAGPELYQWDAGVGEGTALTSDAISYWGMWGVASGQAWAVGYDPNSTGAISERAPNGSWSTPTLYPSLKSFNAIHGTSADNVWVVGDSNSLLHRTDAGWQTETLPVSATTYNFFSVWAAPEGDVYMTTDSPTVVRHERDGGWSTFTPSGADGVDLRGVYGFPNGDLWFSGGAYDEANDEWDGGYALRYHRQE
ncbi:MAG: hypothetical protein ACJ8AT_26895 [Hyalangium sp.]|uniref:hypothetical protein n=1 Tax=Hyalangium sp. TaxID=2028555 RepID=UPI00389A4171